MPILPPAPYDACDKQPGRVNSLSLVRCPGTDYSVPTAFGHREVLVRGYVDSVVICCGAEVIARHVRSYEREDFVLDPLHYLALLERKIGALDQAAPLAGWVPEEFATLRRLLEARMGRQGKCRFVQVLRLLEIFPLDGVTAGVRDFLALPSLNKALVLELARSEYVLRRENVIAVGNSGTGKTHIALGLAARQKGLSVGFATAAAVVHELIEARDDKRLLRLQRQLAGYKLLVIDELGYVPLSQTGAELLFEVFSQRYERGSTIVTSNLPFDEWTGVFASERLTGALLDRLTHHVHILEMNGDSYRLKQSKQRQRGSRPVEAPRTPLPSSNAAARCALRVS